MSLQLQITTSLGRESRQFSERGPDKPIVLGRGASCDVQLPSTRVAGQQAAFFFTRGRWAVQNVDPRVPLTVNGRRIDAATPIDAGDVVSLGAPEDPTTIVVLQANASLAAVPAGAPAQVGASAVAARAEGRASPQAAVEDVAVGWTPAAPSRSRAAARARRADDSTGSLLVVGIILTIAFVAAAFVLFHRQQTGYWFWQTPQSAPPPEAKPAAPVDDEPAGRGSKLFGAAPASPSDVRPQPAPSKPVAAGPSAVSSGSGSTDASATSSTAPAAPATDAPAPAPGGIESDPTYQKFVDVYYRSDVATALYQLEDYLRKEDANATPELRAEVKKLRDKLLDKLWWQRLRDVQQQYARAKKEVDNFARDYPPSTLAQYSQARKRELIAQRDQAAEDLKIAQATLTDDFNHPLAQPAPNPSDLDAIAAARQKRDAAKWETFQRRVINTVMRTRGAMAY